MARRGEFRPGLAGQGAAGRGVATLIEDLATVLDKTPAADVTALVAEMRARANEIASAVMQNTPR